MVSLPHIIYYRICPTCSYRSLVVSLIRVREIYDSGTPLGISAIMVVERLAGHDQATLAFGEQVSELYVHKARPVPGMQLEQQTQRRWGATRWLAGWDFLRDICHGGKDHFCVKYSRDERKHTELGISPFEGPPCS
jgi:hypothetical protein